MCKHPAHSNAVLGDANTDESSLSMTHVSTKIFLYYKNNFIPDSSLFFRKENQFSVALCEQPFSHILTFASFIAPLFPLGCHSASAPPALYHQPFPVSLLLSCLPSLLQSLHPYHPLCLSLSQSLWPLCLPLPLSWTHVGLIELEDPALIKGRVWLNASKPLRLQSRTG